MSEEGPSASTRNFRLYVASRTFSGIGDAMAPVAIAFAALQDLGGAAALGVLVAAAGIPQVVLLLAGGAISDRYSRRRILLMTDAAQFAVQLTIGMLLVLGQSQLLAFILLRVLYGASAAFFQPALTGLLPSVVETGQLQRANSVVSLSRSTSRVVGPAAAGLLVTLADPAIVILLDAATFAVSWICIALMRVSQAPALGQSSLLREVIDGLRDFWRFRWLVWGALHSSIYLLVVAPAVNILGPVLASEHSGGPALWGVVLAVRAAGDLLGAFALLRHEVERRMFVSVVISLLEVPLLVGLAFWSPWILIPAAMLSGIAGGVGLTLYLTAMQAGVPESSLSRISSVDLLASVAVSPLGVIAVGAAASASAPVLIVLVVAAVHTVSTAAIASVPSLRRERAATEALPLAQK